MQRPPSPNALQSNDMETANTPHVDYALQPSNDHCEDKTIRADNLMYADDIVIHAPLDPPSGDGINGQPAISPTSALFESYVNMRPMISHPVRIKRNMFALIIGINDYVNCRKLYGAVADAKAIEEYLEEDLLVPKDHIHTLFDGEATREAIIEAFKNLRDDARIKEDDPIVIFYAGHGGELLAPYLWGPLGVETKIQCLIPQDYQESAVHPIPDRTIGALIEKIANVKGDNITVILDCCHSASLTRVKNGEYAPRTVTLKCSISGNLDWDIWGGRFAKIAPGFAHHGLRSHVLFAACGERELAYEYQGHGHFTTELLKTLRNNAIDDLTCTNVLERIHLTGPFNQNPLCEGVNRHRIVFDVRTPAGRQVRYSVHVQDSGKYVIGAGLAHGVSNGVELTLYRDQKQSGISIVVDETAVIEDFQTTLFLSTDLANLAFAKLTCVGNLPLYLTPGGNLSQVFTETLQRMRLNGNMPTFRLVEDVIKAKLELDIENELVILRVLDQRLKRFGLSDLSFNITLDRLVHALDAAAHYYWYLDLSRKDHRVEASGGVTVDFYLLEESEVEYGDDGLALLTPAEPGLCKRDPETGSYTIDFAVNPEAPYGIKITNNTSRDFYLNAFLFNNSSLSIAPYYTQPTGSNPDPPLRQNGIFTIGYGSGGIAPFTYMLNEGQQIDVGYLKVFFATRPIDLFDIVQVSPFTRSTAVFADSSRKARLNVTPHVHPSTFTDTWFTLDIPVVQRRREKRPVV